MTVNKVFFMITVLALALAMLACSLGTPVATQPPAAATDAVAATAAPTAELPAAEMPTSASAPVAASGACVNPYMPVVAGATWTYNLTGPVSDSYTHTILAVEGNSFTDQDVFNSGTTRQGKWNCDNGNLIALDLPGGASASVSTQNNGTADFQTTNSSGITLPAIINPGDVWLQSLTLEGTQTVNSVSYQVSNNFNNDCKAVGVESVTVQAGTFDAMRVDCNTTMKISLKLGDTPVENTFNLTGTSWYAQGVGMVKSLTSGMGLDSTIELVSYNIP